MQAISLRCQVNRRIECCAANVCANLLRPKFYTTLVSLVAVMNGQLVATTPYLQTRPLAEAVKSANEARWVAIASTPCPPSTHVLISKATRGGNYWSSNRGSCRAER